MLQADQKFYAFLLDEMQRPESLNKRIVSIQMGPEILEWASFAIRPYNAYNPAPIRGSAGFLLGIAVYEDKNLAPTELEILYEARR